MSRELAPSVAACEELDNLLELCGEAGERADIAWAKTIPAWSRIELSPACDLWMRGARFATVMEHGHSTMKVRVDGLKGHKRLAYGLIYARL